MSPCSSAAAPRAPERPPLHRAARGAAGPARSLPAPSPNAKRQALISSAASSAQREAKKRNPFSINTFQVHSSNQAEAAVKNSSAPWGWCLVCWQQKGSVGQARRQRVGRTDTGHPPGTRHQGVEHPTCVGHGWCGHSTQPEWGRTTLGTADPSSLGHGCTGHWEPTVHGDMSLAITPPAPSPYSRLALPLPTQSLAAAPASHTA